MAVNGWLLAIGPLLAVGWLLLPIGRLLRLLPIRRLLRRLPIRRLLTIGTLLAIWRLLGRLAIRGLLTVIRLGRLLGILRRRRLGRVALRKYRRGDPHPEDKNH